VLGGSIGLCSDGGFAPRVRFPAYCAVKLPDAVSDRAGALLEPLAVALHAFDRAAARPGETVVVLGFGPIGAACALVGKALGLRCLVSEPNPARRARAGDLGFAASAPEGEPRDIARALRAATDGGADIVIEASGVAAVLELAPELTVRGGRIVVVGIPKQPVALDAGRLVLYERSIIATLGYADDLPRVATMIATGQLAVERLITKVVPLEQTPSELERLADGPGDDLKVLVSVGG
jgi:(R,R)-butanediol dehydrogenase/meso-butanediol dehydrogenase/diacetyl reductase